MGKLIKNKLLYLALFYPLISYSEIASKQETKLPIQSEIQKEEINILSSENTKLIQQYVNFETYRPDSFSDASRNPFGPKRYKFEDLVNSNLFRN